MRMIGFSTGAIALGDFNRSLKVLAPFNLPSIELSALRMIEVQPLIDAIPHLDLCAYEHISIHAPSTFSVEEEAWLVDLFARYVPCTWPIILHPDAIHDFSTWKMLGQRVAIENMDRRKPVGRSTGELATIFDRLPEAGLCFDVGHARQFDPSMTEAFLTLKAFKEKLVQVHISEVNSESQHEPISYGAQLAYQQIAGLIPSALPIILESRVPTSRIRLEVERAEQAVTPTCIEEPCYA